MNPINHPDHYGGESSPFETIKIIEALGWGDDFCLGNALKYIMRAGKKSGVGMTEDLKKAIWYLKRVLDRPAEVKAPEAPPEHQDILDHLEKLRGFYRGWSELLIHGGKEIAMEEDKKIMEILKEQEEKKKPIDEGKRLVVAVTPEEYEELSRPLVPIGEFNPADPDIFHPSYEPT